MVWDMKREDLSVGVVGAGAMGRGIAQVAAVAGIPVLLSDARAGAAEEAVAFVGDMLDRAVAKGRMDRDAAEAAKGRLGVVEGIAAFASCAVVVEAVVEDLEVKRLLFAELEGVVAEDCILATNTSSLSVTAIAAACARPERVAGFHFFNPAPLMKLVEVIPGVRTEPGVVAALGELARRVGHTPVTATDTPGFLVNHAGRAYGTEALRIVGEGIADFASVDRILRDALGFRMGPFELLDLTGLDVSHPVFESIYDQFYQEPRYRPSPITRRRLAAGFLGRKAGRGFYEYREGSPVAPAPPPVPAGRDVPVWISRGDPAACQALRASLGAAGAELEGDDAPGAASLCVVTPLGADCTTAALAEGLDPARTVAVDMLVEPVEHWTVMGNPATRRDMLDSAHALFARTGVPTSVIGDSPGFVAQRVIAMVVSVACDIAQQRIATPEDIDLAVTLGLGYPHGPLAWGDRLGPRRILAILEAMHAFYADPRYRPSPWLKRRALLG
ncbi:MAG: 3-hydroxyacyl-CoA dehydrogenase, partial [Alphaproteobacteria bacterium]